MLKICVLDPRPDRDSVLLCMVLILVFKFWSCVYGLCPVSRAEVTGRLSLPDATSAHAREIVGSFGPQ